MLSGGIGMGQLIKLQNYTSRYEQNIFHYPSRFVMLKKQQWDRWQRRRRPADRSDPASLRGQDHGQDRRRRSRRRPAG